jgi:hypothetical protein
MQNPTSIFPSCLAPPVSELVLLLDEVEAKLLMVKPPRLLMVFGVPTPFSKIDSLKLAGLVALLLSLRL